MNSLGETNCSKCGNNVLVREAYYGSPEPNSALCRLCHKAHKLVKENLMYEDTPENREAWIRETGGMTDLDEMLELRKHTPEENLRNLFKRNTLSGETKEAFEKVMAGHKRTLDALKMFDKDKYSLEELTAQMTPENDHKLIDFGPDVGEEIIEPYMSELTPDDNLWVSEEAKQEFEKEMKKEEFEAHPVAKVPLDLIPPEAIEAMALAFQDGAKKYGAHDWEFNGFDPKERLAANMRHGLSLLMGQTHASDSGLHHAAHMLADAAMIYVQYVRQLYTHDHNKCEPNAETIAALKESDEGNLKSYDSVEEMMKDLHAEFDPEDDYGCTMPNFDTTAKRFTV